MFKNLFKKKYTVQHTCPSRDLKTIKRLLNDGYKLVFKGDVAVLTKTILL